MAERAEPAPPRRPRPWWLLSPRNWGYVLRYVWTLKVRRRHIRTSGFVFLSRGADVACQRGLGSMEIGRWVRVGRRSALRCHEGSLRIGDKTIVGSNASVDAHLDVRIGAECLLADGVYVSDFGHRFDDPDVPIRKQGIVTAPVRIEDDCWIGERAAILRGVTVGTRSVVGAQAVVTRDVPPLSIVVGNPARVTSRRGGSGARANDAAVTNPELAATRELASSRAGTDGAGRSAVIRAATERDMPAVFDLLDALDRLQRPWRVFSPRPSLLEETAARYAEALDDPASVVLVAVEGDRVVGTAMGHLLRPSSLSDEPAVELSGIVVREDARRHGIGRALTAEVARFAGRLGVARVTLKTYARNQGAMEFWRRMGFDPRTVQLTASVEALVRPRDGIATPGS